MSDLDPRIVLYVLTFFRKEKTTKITIVPFYDTTLYIFDSYWDLLVVL